MERVDSLSRCQGVGPSAKMRRLRSLVPNVATTAVRFLGISLKFPLEALRRCAICRQSLWTTANKLHFGGSAVSEAAVLAPFTSCCGHATKVRTITRVWLGSQRPRRIRTKVEKEKLDLVGIKFSYAGVTTFAPPNGVEFVNVESRAHEHQFVMAPRAHPRHPTTPIPVPPRTPR